MTATVELFGGDLLTSIEANQLTIFVIYATNNRKKLLSLNTELQTYT